MLTLNFLMLIKKIYYYFNNHVDALCANYALLLASILFPLDALCANYALLLSSILFPLVRRWRLK